MRIGTLIITGAFIGLTTAIGVRAAQGPPAQGAAPRPLVPMTASTIAREPAAHMGENVSIVAAVDAVLSKTVFTVDQDKAKPTGREVLVIAPTLQNAPDVNAYVTVQGEVIAFDPAEIAKKARNYKLDLPPDVIEKYRGKPAVLATVVLNTGLVDLAKKPIVPMTPAEVALSGAMKTINSAMGVVRAGLEKPDAAQLKEQAAALKKAFTDSESILKSQGIAPAASLASEALKLATSLELGVANAKWDEVKTAATGIQGMCATCHGQFRDRMDDGSYRIRMGGGF